MICDEWMNYALSFDGVAEVVGYRHNPTIIGWLKRLGAKKLGAVVNDDETPWCGTFVAEVMDTVGFKLPSIVVRAASWDKFGQPCGVTYGAVLRFQRPGGGHVGFAVGKRKVNGKTQYRVFGGNQSNKVGYTWIEKERLISSRWPAERPIEYNLLPVFKADGTPASKDEK